VGSLDPLGLQGERIRISALSDTQRLGLGKELFEEYHLPKSAAIDFTFIDVAEP
jgi:hypothetical protein